MTTPTVAIASLITVAQAYFTGLGSDSTYGPMYRTTKFLSSYPIGAFIGNQVALYYAGGTSAPKGIGTMKQWEDDRIAVDVFGRNYAEAEQICNAIWTAWETDFDYYIPATTPTAGQGYLKTFGGLKYLSLDPWSTPGDERVSKAYFRRLAKLTYTIGDA